MRHLLVLLSVISVAAGIWLLQENAESLETEGQIRTPVIRVIDMPLPAEDVVDGSFPASQRNTVESTSDSEVPSCDPAACDTVTPADSPLLVSSLPAS
jgi:hypothetical protein